ncbi:MULTISPECIES: ABC transporter permease subunit [Thalassolituus]|uniref:ABC transporter permease subunit n=1 Tax=Thalassolituus TaxID=187492 RepID=UPI001E34E59A|nr:MULTISPECIES: ABC transporter permease subunit [Thalassolituus]MCB2386145.1 ABC transporter permease [Thalassolituus alkanivorans]MCB2422845.1 ABC transporter permease [Thalassolituus alkanivorans]
MNTLMTICKREFSAYFATPVAYVFIFIFLVMSGVFTFYLGNFYQRGQADLLPFFNFHPWLYLFFMPAVAMGLWSQERQLGTIELLMTLPVTLWQAVLGKFLAAWLFAGLALLLTLPLWLTVNYLGTPDNGVILASYLGSWLMAGAFIAVGSCMSALSRNQIVAFILTVVVCFVLMLSGFPLVLDFFRGWASEGLLDLIASLSFLTHFEALARGVVDIRDLLYFILVIAVWLLATTQVLTVKKSA